MDWRGNWILLPQRANPTIDNTSSPILENLNNTATQNLWMDTAKKHDKYKEKSKGKNEPKNQKKKRKKKRNHSHTPPHSLTEYERWCDTTTYDLVGALFTSPTHTHPPPPSFRQKTDNIPHRL